MQSARMATDADNGTQVVPRRAVRRLGRYVLIEDLAKGGMSAVHVAWREGSSDVVALKRLLPERITDPIATRRFEREATVARLLDHHNIARTIDVSTEAGVLCIASELVSGVSVLKLLEVLWKEQLRVPPRIAVAIVSGVLDALAYAHDLHDERGKPLEIVHRDLSPHNILVSAEGEVKLIDFGIARGKVDEFKTEPGVIVGSLEYMSPEQASSEVVQRTSDIYSLSVVLYEMLSGRPVARADQLVELISAILRKTPPPLCSVAPEVPKWLEQAVAKGLSKAPSNRFQSAPEYLAALRPPGFAIAGRAEIASFLAAHCHAELEEARARLSRAREAIGQGTAPMLHDFSQETEPGAGETSIVPRRRGSSIEHEPTLIRGPRGELAYAPADDQTQVRPGFNRGIEAAPFRTMTTELPNSAVLRRRRSSSIPFAMLIVSLVIAAALGFFAVHVLRGASGSQREPQPQEFAAIPPPAATATPNPVPSAVPAPHDRNSKVPRPKAPPKPPSGKGTASAAKTPDAPAAEPKPDGPKPEPSPERAASKRRSPLREAFDRWKAAPQDGQSRGGLFTAVTEEIDKVTDPAMRDKLRRSQASAFEPALLQSNILEVDAFISKVERAQ